MSLKQDLLGCFWKFLYKLNPRWAAEFGYYRITRGNRINWSCPTDLREKIVWLQFNSDTSLWTLCADKYRVREYVKNKGCSEILNELYGVWNNPEEIDYESLPNSFVLKTNNSCGQLFIIKDKTNINIKDVNEQLKKWLKAKYGYHGAQTHYLRIKPCIIAEKLLINDADPNMSLVDYKVWCFNGKPEIIWVAFNRTKDSYEFSAYDLEWNNVSDKVLDIHAKHYSGKDFPRPNDLDHMIQCAKVLSADFPEVRVDFYECMGKAIFGEMTFTAGNVYFTQEYYNELGSKIDL